jgi:hypothetical protein
LVPPWFTRGSLAVVPLIAVLLALLFRRRPSRLDSARLADVRTGSKDLFLTAVLADASPGDYRGLVLAEAERRAVTIKPEQVVRCEWGRCVGFCGGSLALLCATVFWLPQLDPFGKQEGRERVALQRTQLQEGIKATALRAALLAEVTEVRSNDIAQAVAGLTNVFNTAKPEDKAGTFARLGEEQKVFGELWKRAGDAKLQDALNKAAGLQNFGLGDSVKAQQWKSDLERGDLSSVKKELADLKALAEKLAEAKDSVTGEGIRREMTDRLQQLRDAMAQQMNSAALDAAFQRAMEQLQMAAMKGVSAEALKGLEATLGLTADELKQLAQSMNDLKAMEDALKAIQSAKRLNGVKPLDGAECGACKKPAEYAALYDSLYGAACGAPVMLGGQPGSGLNGGPGEGPRPYGDENQGTGFTPKQAPSAYQPGQILMSWKTRGVSDPGQAREAFEQAIQAARQEAGEAVLEEQIPASYHSTIKTYFDSLNDESTRRPTP